MTASTIIGKRIRLIFTNDPYTRLKTGDMGTITYASELPSRVGGERQLWVSWDSGSNLAMIEGKDFYEILEVEDKEDTTQ
jgi:Domain of unknown function (DUF4314)